jgi:UDP-3-O-[3-hydroxymyristoyl] N-acetylglucosamine deacetylase
MGDLALLGGPIIGHISAYKSGHELNNKFVKAILADPSLYSIVSFDQPEEFEIPDYELHAWHMPDRATA